MTPRVPERVVQRQVVGLLRALGAHVYVLGTVRPRGDYPGTHQTPGLPDLLVFLRGRLLCIEVKAAGGRLRPGQVLFREDCLQAGIAHVVGGVDEVLAWLMGQGLIRPDQVSHERQPAVQGARLGNDPVTVS
jgi:hypothetical protein